MLEGRLDPKAPFRLFFAHTGMGSHDKRGQEVLSSCCIQPVLLYCGAVSIPQAPPGHLMGSISRNCRDFNTDLPLRWRVDSLALAECASLEVTWAGAQAKEKKILRQSETPSPLRLGRQVLPDAKSAPSASPSRQLTNAASQQPNHRPPACELLTSESSLNIR